MKCLMCDSEAVKGRVLCPSCRDGVQKGVLKFKPKKKTPKKKNKGEDK